MAVGLPTVGHMALYKMCAAGRTGHPRSLSFIVILSPFFIVILSEAKDPVKQISFINQLDSSLHSE